MSTLRPTILQLIICCGYHDQNPSLNLDEHDPTLSGVFPSLVLSYCIPLNQWVIMLVNIRNHIFVSEVG